ncbi:hypothetical protein ACWDNI_35975 [Nocardia niigatensis]
MRTVAALPIAAAALLLAGCGTSDDKPHAAPSSAPASTSAVAATTAPAKSQRGNLVKAVGSEAGMSLSAGSDPVLKWTVTNIQVDAPCAAPSVTPQNGHFVVVSIDAQTSAAFDPAGPPAGFFHPGNYWNIVDANGVTQSHPDTTQVYSCNQGDWPVKLAPASRYKFHLTFDSPTPTGTLTFVPVTGAPGWEWTF